MTSREVSIVRKLDEDMALTIETLQHKVISKSEKQIRRERIFVCTDCIKLREEILKDFNSSYILPPLEIPKDL